MWQDYQGWFMSVGHHAWEGYLVMVLLLDLPLGALQLLDQGVLGEKASEPGTLRQTLPCPSSS